MRGAGVAAGAALFTGTATSMVDDALNTDGGIQEIIVVFEDTDDVDDLDRFDLPNGYYAYDVLPLGHTRATGEQIEQIAALDSVRYVQENRELDLHNDDARELIGAEAVQNTNDDGVPDVSGGDVHVAVIDTGITLHRDLQDSVVHNYRYVNPTTSRNDDQVWVDFGDGDADDLGHGSHVTGSIAGDGTESDGQYRGMAPDATVTAYATNVGVFVAMLAAAVDDMLRKQREGEADFQLVNNSFGTSHDGDFNPADAANVAYWEAFREGILPVFSAGNDGSDHGTLNYLGKAPYSLCVAATYDGDFGRAKAPTDFSSRGRPPASDRDARYAQDYDFSAYEDNEGPNYDRRTALRNVERFHRSGQDEAGELAADPISATVEPTVSDVVLGETLVGGESTFVHWTSPEGAGFLDAQFEMEPPRQTVYVTLREGGEEGRRIADGGRFINDGTFELQAPIEGDTEYTFEFYGFNNVQTDIEGVARALDAVPRPDGPFGMYRCDVGAPGNEVVSTITHREALTYLAPTSGDSHTENPWYDAMSGTSMSCPVTVGGCALVFQAYRDAAGRFPKPIDVINIVEATAEGGTDEELDVHTEANMGAGFLDIERAVELAGELGARAGKRGSSPKDEPTAPAHPHLWNQVELCSYSVRSFDGELPTDPACIETVDESSFGGELLVGAAGPTGQHEATTDEFSTSAFSGSEFSERLMDVSVSVDGPPGFEWTELDVEHERDGEWVVIGAKRDDAGDGEIQVIDGYSDPDAEAPAVVADDETYRIVARAQTTLDTVASYEIDVAFQAFDPDC